MGIQDRDYYRDNSNGFLEAWGRQSAVTWLIVITSVIFFAQMLTGGWHGSELYRVGHYSLQQIQAGEIWRLFTPLFLHDNLIRLFFYMLILYWTGKRLEEIYGSREIVIYYLIAGVFALAINLLAQVAGITSPQIEVIGAGGAVTAVLVLFAIHYPQERVLLFFVLPVPVWIVVILFVCMDIISAARVGIGGFGYFTHLGGALFGFLYYQSGLRFSSFFPRSPAKTTARRSRPPLRLHPIEPDNDDTAEPVGAAVENQPRVKEVAEEHMEAKLDRILEKVSRQGQESLTAEEREVLVKASEIYKRRRK